MKKAIEILVAERDKLDIQIESVLTILELTNDNSLRDSLIKTKEEIKKDRNNYIKAISILQKSKAIEILDILEDAHYLTIPTDK